ncbi:MAG: peptide deformylase [Bryobacterales bacterium]|nr:peptide deformylase [Bryobacterales bacterium]
MPVRRILQLGDPLLRSISQEVTQPEAVLADLRDTLHAFQATHGFGRGISAVQIGEPVRVIYIEIDGRAYSLVNPRYEVLSAETFLLWDDCFSFPNLMVKVRRSVTVRIAYRDADGSPRTLEASGPFAELLQHEMDHLDGILAVDRAIDRESFLTREEWLRQGRPQPAG